MPQFENTPSDRVQLVGLGELPSPATCIVCGSGNYEEGYVDFRTFVEYHGALLICGLCLIQASELIGCRTPDEVEHQADLMSEVAQKNEQLTQELDSARAIIAGFESLRSAFSAIDSSSAAGDDASETAPSELENSGASVTAPDSDESKSDEPVKVSKRGNSGGTKSGNTAEKRGSLKL